MKPHKLLDAIKFEFNLRFDADVSRLLDVEPPQISKLRSSQYEVSDSMILIVYDKTGWSIEKIRSFL